jgi:DNA-binding transcriptional LysR family regulator
MSDLNSLSLFARVVDLGGFSEAARRLGIPLSTVSRRIAELESDLGVRLLERSTRNARVTDIGAQILEHARMSTELIETVDRIASKKQSDVSGMLRLSTPPSVSDTLVMPLVSAFQKSYPDVRVQIFVTERYVDHISDGIDLALRIGNLKDSSLVARKILRYREQLVASPRYLEKRGIPVNPNELLNHHLLDFWYGRPQSSWELKHVGGVDKEAITFVPNCTINDFIGLAWALDAGNGIGVLPPVVRPDLIREGRLIEILPEWRLDAVDVSLVHTENRYISKAMRIFKDFAYETVSKLFPNLPS